jgi:predicted ester cyclase
MFGRPPTGRPVPIEGYDILRIRDGKIIEAWIEQDRIGLLRQIGAVPDPTRHA